MASQSKYEILIPQTGSDVATRALQYVGDNLSPDLASVDRNREVYRDGIIMHCDVLTIQVNSSPQADSTMKQIGVYVADATDTSPVYVSKQDKSGIQVWPMHSKLDK